MKINIIELEGKWQVFMVAENIVRYWAFAQYEQMLCISQSFPQYFTTDVYRGVLKREVLKNWVVYFSCFRIIMFKELRAICLKNERFCCEWEAHVLVLSLWSRMWPSNLWGNMFESQTGNGILKVLSCILQNKKINWNTFIWRKKH